MQAGSSGRGRDFAAQWAEVVFTLQHAKSDMQTFYADVKARVERAGRRPEDWAILPGSMWFWAKRKLSHEKRRSIWAAWSTQNSAWQKFLTRPVAISRARISTRHSVSST